jgi:hypothetical protein
MPYVQTQYIVHQSIIWFSVNDWRSPNVEISISKLSNAAIWKWICEGIPWAKVVRYMWGFLMAGLLVLSYIIPTIRWDSVGSYQSKWQEVQDYQIIKKHSLYKKVTLCMCQNELWRYTSHTNQWQPMAFVKNPIYERCNWGWTGVWFSSLLHSMVL